MNKKNGQKLKISPEFLDFLEAHYPEHLKRILNAKVMSSFIKFYYPFLGLIISSLIMGGLLIIFNFFILNSSMDNFYSKLFMGNDIKNIKETLIVVFYILKIISIAIIILAFIIGISIGLNNSHNLLFNAEKLLASMQINFLLIQNNYHLKGNSKILNSDNISSYRATLDKFIDK